MKIKFVLAISLAFFLSSCCIIDFGGIAYDNVSEADPLPRIETTIDKTSTTMNISDLDCILIDDQELYTESGEYIIE